MSLVYLTGGFCALNRGAMNFSTEPDPSPGRTSLFLVNVTQCSKWTS